MQNSTSEPKILSREERLALQARAAAGEIPTLSEIRDYIHTTRVGYLARSEKSKANPPKSRLKKAVVDESQVDFF